MEQIYNYIRSGFSSIRLDNDKLYMPVWIYYDTYRAVGKNFVECDWLIYRVYHQKYLYLMPGGGIIFKHKWDDVCKRYIQITSKINL